jgi:hypothetical protein
MEIICTLTGYKTSIIKLLSDINQGVISLQYLKAVIDQGGLIDLQEELDKNDVKKDGSKF